MSEPTPTPTPIINPPGLESYKVINVLSSADVSLAQADSDGDSKHKSEFNWLPIDVEKTHHALDGFIYDDQAKKILLLWAKPGAFGEGKVVPIIAGPAKDGKTDEDVLREVTKDQTGGLEPTGFEHRGYFFIVNEGNVAPYFMPVYRITSWTGEPSETATHIPEWFAPSDSPADRTSENTSLKPVPFDKVFEDERHFYPLFFAGKKTIARADYSASAKKEEVVGPLLRWWIGELA